MMMDEDEEDVYTPKRSRHRSREASSSREAMAGTIPQVLYGGNYAQDYETYASLYDQGKEGRKEEAPEAKEASIEVNLGMWSNLLKNVPAAVPPPEATTAPAPMSAVTPEMASKEEAETTPAVTIPVSLPAGHIPAPLRSPLRNNPEMPGPISPFAIAAAIEPPPEGHMPFDLESQRSIMDEFELVTGFARYG
jgi:hypothetical protein